MTLPLAKRICKPLKNGTPGKIRTCDLLLRRQALYPAELRARTHMKNEIESLVQQRVYLISVEPATVADTPGKVSTSPIPCDKPNRCDRVRPDPSYRS